MIRNLWKLVTHPSGCGRFGRPPALDYAGESDVGRVRANNEDRWLAAPDAGLFLVSDGMGGHFAGELASHLVVEVLPAQVCKAIGDARDFTDSEAAARVVQAVARISRQMREESEGRPGLSGMGATLLMVLIRGMQALIVHMGDSRAYVWRKGTLRRLTTDHTIVQLLLDEGVLQPQEAGAHPGRNQLTRFIGMPGDPLPDVQLFDLLVGDRLLLCTDGLTSAVDDRQLSAILSEQADLQRSCHDLVDAANSAGGRDNITVLMLGF